MPYDDIDDEFDDHDFGEFDESDTTAEEFDAMWASATPVETIGPVAVNAPGQNFWLVEFALLPATYTNENEPPRPLPTVVPATDTTEFTGRPASTNVVPQPA